MSEKSRAIVIRQADFSESSRVVTFWTREFGKLSVLAKGGRRAKNAFDGALDLLAESDVVLIRKADALSILTEAALVSRYRPAPADMNSLYGGYYVAELIDRLTEPADPHCVLYDHTTQALRDLAAGERSLRTISRFEVLLLVEIGQYPAFDHCLACGVEAAVDSDETFVHWVSQGGVLCRRCRVGSFSSRELRPSTITLMQRLADTADDLSDLTKLKRGEVVELRSVLNQLIAYAMERQPRAAKMLNF